MNCLSCYKYFKEPTDHLYKEQCVTCLGRERDAMMAKLIECSGDVFLEENPLKVQAELYQLRFDAIRDKSKAQN